MIKILGLLFLIICVVCFVYYEKPCDLLDIYTKKLVNPRTWGKIEIVEEKRINSLKNLFLSELVWQTLEQLIGFVTGILICFLIGWRVSCCRSISEKSFESSMIEWTQRQDRFEKQLHALQLKIVEIEKTYLVTKKETACADDTCQNTSTLTEEQKPIASKISHENNKNGKSEGCEKKIREAEKRSLFCNILCHEKEIFEASCETCHESVDKNYSQSEVIVENTPYEFHSCTSKEKLANISDIGAGECEETYQGKIVPISQIPQYQEFRKSHKQKTNSPKEIDDDKLVPFTACGKSAIEVISEKIIPQTTPRKNTPGNTENGGDRSTSKGVRRKQRS